MIRKSGFLIVGILVMGLSLSGCNLVAQPADVATENPIKVLTGKIMIAGNVISLVDGAGKTTEITSRKADLKQYNGKQVTVTGEFSGTTLFVDTVK